MSEGMTILIIMIITIEALAFIMVIASIMSKSKNNEDKLRKEERIKRENEYQEKIAALKEKFGDITLEISLLNGTLNWDDLNLRIFIFENSQIALIEGNPIPFKKILAYNLTYNEQTISTTNGKIDAKTSTGSMAGRALVGGVLLGGVGALAGASTAKKDGEIHTTTISRSTNDDYIIYLGLDDMANPQRVLMFGSDAESANKAASIFNIIISRNFHNN